MTSDNSSVASDYRPKRSILYMPGSNERVLAKAPMIAADAVIFDLEDAVAPDAKLRAREQACTAVSASRENAEKFIIRINALDTEWGEEDLAASVAAKPGGILAPKVSTASDIHTLGERLLACGAHSSLMLWVMIETPLALLNLKEIAAAAAQTPLAGFVMGTNDLAKELRAKATLGREAFVTALATTVAAARAYGLYAIDGVFNDINDDDGFRTECVQGRTLGFDGKTLIHPSQIDTCNEIFSPSANEISHARDVIKAFELPENKNKGVIKVNGKMTERLHLEQANRVSAIAESLGV